MPKIVELFAFVICGADGEDEGIMEIPGHQRPYPLIGGDIEKVQELIPLADRWSAKINRRYVIKHFKFDSEINIGGAGNGRRYIDRSR